MGNHYLVDLYGNPLGSSKVIDTRTALNGQSFMNGTFVVRVPDGVSVTRPANLTDLTTQKYAGLLAFYAGFTKITFDDLLDASAISVGSSSKIFMGDRASIALLPGGILQSVVVPLTGGAPTVALTTWETFQVTATDVKTDRFQRTYVEVPSTPSNVTCSVSFDGGATFNSTTDASVLNIPIPDQGTNYVIRLTNASANKLFIGSWAVIY